MPKKVEKSDVPFCESDPLKGASRGVSCCKVDALITIDGRGQIKITDFGLAGLDSTIDGADARAGTPGYMAPEQWAGNEVTAKSDLYALGLLLYELFTGERPYKGKTPAEILEAQEYSTPVTPSSAPGSSCTRPSTATTASCRR